MPIGLVHDLQALAACSLMIGGPLGIIFYIDDRATGVNSWFVLTVGDMILRMLGLCSVFLVGRWVLDFIFRM